MLEQCNDLITTVWSPRETLVAALVVSILVFSACDNTVILLCRVCFSVLMAQESFQGSLVSLNTLGIE
jgi:hypothetical protein